MRLPHPEVLKEVKIVFDRLSSSNPEVNGSTLWDMARKIRYVDDMADYELFKHVYFNA